MVFLLFILFIIVVAWFIYTLMQCKPSVSDSSGKSTENNNAPTSKLLDLNTTTVAQRQQAYNHGFREQLQYDELQRRAEAAGDTATIEAIRLGTYDGPLPVLNEDKPISVTSQPKVKVVLGGGKSDAPVQKLKYFCIKDKGYHVSVWPKDQSFLDIVEFNIAGMSYRDNIDNYLGEFHGTLEPEPTNPYDSNAIKVLAPDGHHVGYVPKDMTEEVHKYATLPCECFCYIGENDGVYFSDCYITR